MAITDPEAIKDIIRGNFDHSVEKYEDFEEEHGLFALLTQALAATCGVEKGMSVWDIGCGTGASTFPLADIVGPEGTVLAIDNSEEMLGAARARAEEYPNVKLISGDAEAIDSCYMEPGSDAVLYNACIFLLPNPANTLKCAHGLLKDGGVAGMTYMLGIHDRLGGRGEGSGESDLLEAARDAKGPFSPYGRSLVDVKGLPDMMEQAGFSKVERGVISVEAGKDLLRGFYRIPAQSSALWPKTPYEERVGLLEMLLECLGEKSPGGLYQWWGWAVGWK